MQSETHRVYSAPVFAWQVRRFGIPFTMFFLFTVLAVFLAGIAYAPEDAIKYGLAMVWALMGLSTAFLILKDIFF